MDSSFCLKGDICYAKEMSRFTTYQDSYLVCEGGKTAGVYSKLPECYSTFPLYDYTGKLIIPGMVDLHLHAPQYAFRGLGMDMELLDWLNNITFPIEAEYRDLEYSNKAYSIFSEDLKKSATTRACIFATIHVPAAEMLMRMLNEAGIVAYVGKVNMDRNSPDYLRETTVESIKATKSWIEKTGGLYKYVKPIITPRFIPSCTDNLMKELADLKNITGLPAQSHLNENLSEIEWVRNLCPNTKGYADAYDSFGLFDGEGKTIMAHCVYMREEEIKLLAEKKIFIAHSPESNTNLRSGIAPVRSFIKMGCRLGLASDVAGGESLNMFRVITEAIKASKLRWRLLDSNLEALKVCEAFYLATKGGGEFFGHVGSFEDGYEFDAVVIDDLIERTSIKLDIEKRVERSLYIAESNCIKAKFVAGRKIL